jgi:hypothetical protein
MNHIREKRERKRRRRARRVRVAFLGIDRRSGATYWNAYTRRPVDFEAAIQKACDDIRRLIPQPERRYFT